MDEKEAAAVYFESVRVGHTTGHACERIAIVQDERTRAETLREVREAIDSEVLDARLFSDSPDIRIRALVRLRDAIDTKLAAADATKEGSAEK